MKKKILISFTYLALFLAVGLFNKAKAADQSAGITVSPPLTERSAESSAALSGKIKVTNSSATNSLSIQVSVEDFAAKGEEGQPNFVDPETNASGYSLAKWIEVEKSFTLKPDESKEVSYTINVPQNAEAGGHYGAIFFSPSASPGADNGGVTAIPKVGALMLITVPGNIQYDGRIVEFSSKKLFTNSSNTVEFLTRFENLSSVHVKPTGNIEIKNLLGKSVASLPVNEKFGNVLPKSIRKFDNEWTKKYGFGEYKATVNLTYADGKTATAEISFWVIPWKETAGAIVMLLIIIWILSHLSWKKPNAEQPIVAQQNIAQPNAEQPIAAQSNTMQPNTEQSNAEQNEKTL